MRCLPFFLLLAAVLVPVFAFSMSSKPKAPGVSSSSSDVWIVRASSCGIRAEHAVEDGEAELRRAGVRVLGSRRGSEACSLNGGSPDAYRISRDDLVKAASLGYQEARL